ncbi:peptidoglycan-binding protein [Lacrimispora sp. HJ-01]|uniref:peptidoglycan-binding domain-containing protein n=1 Tax=Lacrimispora sp. HJ-01 TaxID=3375704 RepID=UPI0038501941
MNERGYDCGTPDGIMGKKTKSALMKFQEDNGLTVDGIIGEQVTIALEINLQ